MALFSTIVVLGIVLLPRSEDREPWLLPSFAVLLWSLSTYFFITAFQEVPAAADDSSRFIARVKRRLARSWFWLIGVAFLGTTLAMLFFTYKAATLWIRMYWAG